MWMRVIYIILLFIVISFFIFFFFSSRRRHTRYWRDWSSDVCSSDLARGGGTHQQGSSQGTFRRRGYREGPRGEHLPKAWGPLQPLIAGRTQGSRAG